MTTATQEMTPAQLRMANARAAKTAKAGQPRDMREEINRQLVQVEVELLKQAAEEDESTYEAPDEIGNNFQSADVDRGFVTVYATEDGLPSRILTSAISRILSRKHKDGTRVFVMDPSQAPVYVHGAHRCLLHADHPGREALRDIGISHNCPKSNIPNLFEVNEHVRLKHPRSWRAIDLHRVELDKAEQRDFMRVQTEAMRAMAARQSD